MKVALRDDDISWFTRVDRVEHVWSGIDVPVTFAVTPFMVATEERHIDGREFDWVQTGAVEHPLRERMDVVAWLREAIAAGRASIALHGCNHRYERAGRALRAEFDADSYDDLHARAVRARAELMALFEVPVDVFVPPDNAISRAGMRAVGDAGMRFVQRALPLRGRDVPLTLDWMSQWGRRLYYRAVHHTVYSRPFDNRYVVEAPAYLFKRAIPLDRMKRDFDVFYRAGLPFTIATHHWELLDTAIRDKLYRLLEYVFRHRDVQLVSLREAMQ